MINKSSQLLKIVLTISIPNNIENNCFSNVHLSL